MFRLWCASSSRPHPRSPAPRPRLHRTGGRTGPAQRLAAALLGPGRARRRSGAPTPARLASHRGGAVDGRRRQPQGGGGKGRAHVGELDPRPLRAPAGGLRATAEVMHDPDDASSPRKKRFRSRTRRARGAHAARTRRATRARTRRARGTTVTRVSATRKPLTRTNLVGAAVGAAGLEPTTSAV